MVTTRCSRDYPGVTDATTKRFPWGLAITIALVAICVFEIRACAMAGQEAADEAGREAVHDVGEGAGKFFEALGHVK